MPCFHPVTVGVLRKPLYPGAKRRWDDQTVPCGSCLGCRLEQARQWSVRILHETRCHESAWFLTLTYSEDHVPENYSLFPEHLREFFKAVRRDYPPKSISYYACGEYGETTQRPHYHAVLYGADFLDRHLLRNDHHGPAYSSDSLASYWEHGLSEFSTVTPKSAAYVAGYVRKKVARKNDPDHYLRVDSDTGELVELVPEFSRMSLKPAIGKRWIEKYWRDVYPRDFVVIDGREQRPPRYYDVWAEQTHDPPCPGGCDAHQKAFWEARKNREDNAEWIPQEKLEVKEKITSARVGLFNSRSTV